MQDCSSDSAALALTGNMDYIPHQLNDPVVSWDSRSDARDAYAKQHGNLGATTDDWVTRAKRHYASFYLANPIRVRELAKANDQNVLLAGLFAGFQNNQGILFIRIVYLDERSLPAILDKQLVLTERELPYTSNAITQELIEGQSERTKAAAEWLKNSKSIALSGRSVRHIEFLIQATAQYDDTVGTRVDVLEITPHHKPRWLQDYTCTSAQ